MADVSSPVAVATEGIFTQVTAGWRSGYGLRADGVIYAWGDNAYGQLGDDSQTQRDTPVSVIGGHRFNYIAAGWSHILGIKTDGSLFGWGDNSLGQLGDGTSVPSSASSPQSIVGDHEFVKVDAGECHSMGLKENGTVWTWGCNEGGQLGYQTFTGAIGTWAFGGGMAIDQNGVLWGWGVNNPSGMIGDGTITNRSSPVSVLNTGGQPWMAITPGPYAGMRQTGDWLDDPCLIPGNCKGVGQTGSNENWGIKDEGNGETSLWIWGAATAGNHGHGDWTTNRSSPVSVLGSGGLGFWIAGSANRSCALDKNGYFWAWGDTGQYPLQFLTPNSFNSPVNVTAAMFDDCPKPCTHPFTATGNKVLSLGNGGLNGILIGFSGQGFAWGTNGTAAGHMCQGAAGAGTQWGSPNPITTGAGYPSVWRHAAMGEDNSVWMDEDGNVWMCGANNVENAMVGLKFGGGGPVGRSTPTIIEGSPHNGIKVAAAWTSNTFGFLRADGSLWMWGQNNDGECGVGTTTTVTSPQSVLGSGQSYRFVDFIMGGESGTVALDDTGQVWGWGQWGHVGDNTTTNRSIPTMTSLPLITPEAFRSSPTQIGFEDTGPFFTDIAAGNQHNLAIKEDGTAWAWGDNSLGQLGDGTVTNTGEPKSVLGGHSFIDIAAGTDFSYALKAAEEELNNPKLLMHFDESPIIDSGVNSHVITNTGVSIVSANSKFGGFAGRFNAAESDMLSAPNHVDWDWGSNPWTVHWWMYIHAHINDDGIWTTLHGDLTRGINCCFGAGGGNTAIRIYLGGTGYVIQTDDLVPQGQLVHMAVVNDGYDKLHIFRDGQWMIDAVGFGGKAIWQHSGSLNIVTPQNGFLVGRFYVNSAGFHSNVTIDEFVVVDEALWVEPFTPPTIPTIQTAIQETIWGWGDNTCGKLGDGTITDRSSPVSAIF